jgi:hypothetical protein
LLIVEGLLPISAAIDRIDRSVRRKSAKVIRSVSDKKRGEMTTGLVAMGR